MTEEKETWILYQTTNLINKMIYVGVHKTADTTRSKNYLGSGDRIMAAIRKYGKENFTRKTLAEFDCSVNVYAAEALIVTEEFIKREDTYNISLGGKGGVNLTKEMRAKIGAKAAIRIKSEEEKAKISAGNKGKTLSVEHREKISNSLIGNKYRLGIPHTEEVKKKMSESRKGNKYCLGNIVPKEVREKIAANCPHNKAVIINGKYYQSISLGSKEEKLPYTTLLFRIKSTNPNFNNYCFASDQEKLEHNKGEV